MRIFMFLSERIIHLRQLAGSVVDLNDLGVLISNKAHGKKEKTLLDIAANYGNMES